MDENGNFQHDENETSFEPERDGTFYKHVSPGQYSVCIEPKNPDANVTFPIEIKKAYLAWTDYDSVSENLDFGIQTIQNKIKTPLNLNLKISHLKMIKQIQIRKIMKMNLHLLSIRVLNLKDNAKKPRTMSNHFQKLKLQNTRYYGEY